VLVLDRSGSMKGQPLVDAKVAALSFIGYLDLESRDQSSMVSFVGQSSLDEKLTQDHRALEVAINALRADGGTNIAAGIIEATGELRSRRHTPAATPVILLLTDGNAEGQEATVVEAADIAKALGIRVITIGLGEDVNETLLQAIASADMDSYFAPTSSELEAIYEEIAWILVCPQALPPGE
jgi:Ca-activated chloride channel homolog